MNASTFCLKTLTDRELDESLRAIIARHNCTMAELLAHLAEVDARGLFLRHATPSLFVYCTTRLGFTEDEAGRRIQAARTARRFPVIFEMVARGALSLSAVNILSAHLTEENHQDILKEASGKPKQQLLELVAARWPRPDVEASLRKEPVRKASLPAASALMLSAPLARNAQSSSAQAAKAQPAHAQLADVQAAAVQSATLRSAGVQPASDQSASGQASAASRSALCAPTPTATPCTGKSNKPVLEPLSPGRYKLQVTLSREARDQLLHLQDLMRHSVPTGDLALILERAIDTLCAQVEARRLGKRKRDCRGEGGSDEDRDNGTGQTCVAGDAARRLRAGHRSAAMTAAHPETVPCPDAEAAATSGLDQCSGEPAPSRPPAHECTMTERVTGEHAPARIDGSAALRKRVPNAVRREVIARDGLQCSFVDADGNRCPECGGLELHHDMPVSRGGGSSANGIRLLCRAHHGMQTRADFGADFVRRKVASRRRKGEQRQIRLSGVAAHRSG